MNYSRGENKQIFKMRSPKLAKLQQNEENQPPTTCFFPQLWLQWFIFDLFDMRMADF